MSERPRPSRSLTVTEQKKIAALQIAGQFLSQNKTLVAKWSSSGWAVEVGNSINELADNLVTRIK